MPNPWEKYQNNESKGTPWQKFERPPAYNYVQPQEGQDERIQFEADGQVVNAPQGTAALYAEIENDTIFDEPTSTFDETAAVFEKQGAYIALVANAYGLVDDEDIAEFVANRSRALAHAQRTQPEYMQEFQRQFDDAQGFFETAGVFLSNPRAIGRTAVTQSPNSIMPLMTTLAGTKAGAATGAGIAAVAGQAGPQAALPEEIVTVPAGAVVGGIAGGIVGSGPGTAIVEIGAEIDGMMQEAGVDVTDANAVLRALQDDELMERIKTKAELKGLTTAAVDSVFQIFAGRIIKSVQNAGKVKKVAGAAADVGVQSVGEGAGEAAGQFAKDGEVNYKEAALEAVSAISTSAGQSAIGASARKTQTIAKKVAESRANRTDSDVPVDVEARIAEADATFDQEYADIFERGEPIVQVPEVEVLIERMRENFQVGDLIETKELSGELLSLAENLNSKTMAREQEVRLLEGKEFMPVPRGKAETLTEFLKSKGGVQNEAGELTNLKEDVKGVVKPEAERAQASLFAGLGINAQKGKGLTLDQARELAVEAGYLQDAGGDGVSQSTTDDLVQALYGEADGNFLYRPEDMSLVQSQNEAREFNANLDEYINTQLADAKQYVTFTTAFKEGARLAKKDVKASQEAIINLINSAKMRPADKAKFISSIKNIQSPAKARKELPKIRKRIEALLKADAVRKLRKEITKSLKKTRARKQGGRFKGKYTPEIQAQLNELYRIDKMTKEEANLELEKQFNVDEIPSPEQRTRTAFLMAKAEASEASVESLTDMAIKIKTLIQGGRNVNLYLQSVKDGEVARDANELVDLIGQAEVRDNYDWRSDAKLWLKEKSTNLFNNWAGTLETKLLTAFESTDNKAVTNFINNKASLFRESRAFDTGKRERILEIEQRILDASGMSRKELQKRMYKDTSTMIDLGNMVHADGKTRRVKMTRAEARKRYMEFQDTSLRETLFDENTGNRYTEEIESAIEAKLTEQDIAIAEAQMDFYNDYYERINETYRKLYGVDLPRVEFYSPIRRAAFDTEASEFLQGIATQGSVAPSSTKARVSSRSEILPAGDLEVLMSHVYEMEYFIAFGEKVNHMRRVFGKPEVQRAFKDKMGDEFARSINKDIDYFSGKGSQTAFLGEKTLRAMVRNFGFAQLAAKPQIGIKQLTSFPAMVSDVKAKDFAAGIAEFAKNPKKALAILNESSFFADRGLAIDKDFKALTEDKHFLNIMGKNPGLLKFLMLPIKYGDKGAIAIGGYGHYYAQRKAGMSHEQALDSFARLANKTQQSSDIDQLSQLQQRNDVISQVLTQFMSSPNALARAEYRAIINGIKGRISKQEFAKQIFIYHFLIPNLFVLASNGFDFEGEDHLQASILGTANGVFLIGDILESAVSKAVTGSYFDPAIRHPAEFVPDIMDFVENIAQGDVDLADFWEGGKELNAGLKAVGAGTGVPLATFHNQVTGVRDITEGEEAQGFYKILGYSPWIVDNKILEDGTSKNGF